MVKRIYFMLAVTYRFHQVKQAVTIQINNVWFATPAGYDLLPRGANFFAATKIQRIFRPWKEFQTETVRPPAVQPPLLSILTPHD